jgi:hypothetical protein
VKPPLLKRSITLIELLIAITLLSLIVLGFSSIDLFSRNQVLTVDRRAQVQNEVAYVLEHMTKELSNAIGNTAIPNSSPFWAGPDSVQIGYISDADHDGQRKDPANRRGYRYGGSNPYAIWFCTNPIGAMCYASGGAGAEFLSRRITAFTPIYDSSTNYIEVSLTDCWDPASTSCGTSDNPSVTMSTRIKMPSVSTH